MKNVLSFLLMIVAVSLATVPTTGLVAWYPCDERSSGTSATLYDRSGNGNDFFTGGGSVSNKVIWTDTAKDSFALNFIRASIPTKSRTALPFNFNRAVTVSAWVNFKVAPNINVVDGFPIISKRHAYYFGFTKDGLIASFMDPTDSTYHGIRYPGIDYDTATWYHVMFSIDLDNAVRAIYVNGEKKLLQSYRSFPDTINISADSVILGNTGYNYEVTPTQKSRGELSGNFYSYMDGIRLYDRALTDAEAMQLYLEYDVAQLNLLLNNFPDTLSAERDSSFTLPDSTDKKDPITYTSLHMPVGMMIFGSHPKMLIWSSLTGGITDSVVLVISDGTQTDTVTKVVTITGNSTVLRSTYARIARNNVNIFTLGNQVTFQVAAGVQVAVYDPTGRKVSLSDGKAPLKSGMYLYKVFSSKELCTERFYVK